MSHLIDKSALVAEIKKRKAINERAYMQAFLNSNDKRDSFGYKVQEDNNILSSLNTLEVKEVDLESEIKKIQKEYKTIDEYDGYPATIYANGIERIAKYFFELGLKAQKSEE